MENLEELNASLSRASKTIMLKEPFFGFFLIMMDKSWSTEVKTLGIGKYGINYQLKINPEYWASLPDPHKQGALHHELLHLAFRHLGLHDSYPDKKVLQLSTDLEVNQYIPSDLLPEGAITRDLFPEVELKEKDGAINYYTILKELADKKEKDGTSGCPNLDKLLEEENDHKSWEEVAGSSDTEKDLMERQLNSTLKQAKESTEKSRGTVPGYMTDYIKVEELEPEKFDWKAYLRKFVGYSNRVYMKKTRMKENIKFPDQPSYKIKSKQHILLALDVSGSVSNQELEEFMNEIHHIYKTGVAITIIQCDTEIKDVTSYTGNKLDGINIKGRGGTEFNPVIKYYNEHKQKFTSLIYFTDGECSCDVKPQGHVLWVLSERSSMNNSLPGFVIKLES